MREHTFAECAKLADHYKAIGMTDIYLSRADDEKPWIFATSVTAGGGYRLNGPSGVRVRAEHPCGLSFSWCVDFEGKEANGSGVNQFDRDVMLGAAAKMPPKVRAMFAKFLHDEVLEAVRKRTDEVRDALRKQEDSLHALQSIIISAA